MASENRLALLAGLMGLTLVLSACPGPDTNGNDAGVDAGCTDPNNCPCVDDSDCADPNLFFCNTTTSTCEPSCRTKSDCTAANRGEYALSYCDNNALGCQCDEGTCVAALCSSDADCGSGMACRNGACTQEPAAATAANCQITPDYAVLKAGQKATFWVSFWDASNKPVVLAKDITWIAVGNNRVTVSGTGISAEATGATVGAAEAAIQASAGGATCTAKVAVLDGTIAAGKVRAVVTNELTGRPISGATVTTHSPTDGSAALDTQTTGADGTALLNLPAGTDKHVTVSVFHQDYGYLTYANYDGTTGSRDLSFPLRRNQIDKFGGFKGTFDNVPQSPNVHAGLAAMSIPGSVTDLSVGQLLGATVPTDIVIGSINQQDVPVPAGVYLGFAENQIKTDISAQGVAGVCTSGLSGVTDVEGAINGGTCGTRTAWGLAGDVSLGELPIDAFAGGLNNIDFGKVLSRIIPIFKKFNSSVVRDVQFTLKDTPNASSGNPDFSDTSSFTSGVNLDFQQLPLGFAFATKVPAIPKFKGTYADGVIILGAADVKGRGLVPLGLGAGVNTAEPKDSTVDKQLDLPQAGLVLTRMAPTHHGLEGSEYALAAIAVSLQSVNDASAGLALSATVQRLPENKLVFDPKGATPVEMTGAFMNYPENAKYNFTDATQPGIAGRTFKFINGNDLSAASIVRVQYSDLADHRWQVVTDVATANAGVIVPKPPAGFGDRTYYTGMTTGERSPLLVQAIGLKNGQTAVSFRDLVELNSTNMDRINDFTTAFAVIDYGRPEISWSEPSNGAAVAPASAIKLSVSNFKVGTTASDDGVVKIQFNGGNASCVAFDITTDASAGKGDLAANLPAGCTGANIGLTATLYNNQGNPIAPGVSSTITVTIQ